jgi:hypothetical protein
LSQAPTILPALLPQLDPQAALQMRVERGEEGFGAIAALFGLSPDGSGDRAAAPAMASDGQQAGADRYAPTPSGWWATGSSRAALVSSSAQPETTVRFVSRMHGAAPGLVPGSASAAGLQTPAGWRLFDSARAEASGKGAHVNSAPVDVDARPSKVAAIMGDIGPGATASGVGHDGAPSSDLSPPWRSIPAVSGSGRFVPETNRAPALVNTDPARFEATGAPMGESLSVARPPGDAQGFGDLPRLLSEAVSGRAAEPALREAGPQPTEQPLQRTEGARASASADAALTALRFETGLQAPTAANQSASGSSTVPNPAAASAAGQTFDHVALMVRKGVNEARLQLKPPELGQVDVRIEIDGNEARVQLNAQQSQVRDALEQLLPRLREALAGQGVELTDASVDDSGRQAGQDGTRSERSPDGRIDERAADAGVDGDPEANRDRDSAVSSQGLIDAYA